MKTKRIVTLSLMIATSVLLHYLESLIPSFLPIPGFRIGLANIITLFVLYYFDYKSYLFVLIAKVMFVPLISSGFGIQFFMSMTGSLCSLFITTLLYFLIKPSIYALSSISALFHTFGQLLAYAIFFNTFYIFGYLSILGPLSLLSGILMAILCAILLKRLPDTFKKEEQKRR